MGRDQARRDSSWLAKLRLDLRQQLERHADRRAGLEAEIEQFLSAEHDATLRARRIERHLHQMAIGLAVGHHAAADVGARSGERAFARDVVDND